MRVPPPLRQVLPDNDRGEERRIAERFFGAHDRPGSRRGSEISHDWPLHRFTFEIEKYLTELALPAVRFSPPQIDAVVATVRKLALSRKSKDEISFQTGVPYAEVERIIQEIEPLHKYATNPRFLTWRRVFAGQDVQLQRFIAGVLVFAKMLLSPAAWRQLLTNQGLTENGTSSAIRRFAHLPATGLIAQARQRLLIERLHGKGWRRPYVGPSWDGREHPSASISGADAAALLGPDEEEPFDSQRAAWEIDYVSRAGDTDGDAERGSGEADDESEFPGDGNQSARLRGIAARLGIRSEPRLNLSPRMVATIQYGKLANYWSAFMSSSLGGTWLEHRSLARLLDARETFVEQLGPGYAWLHVEDGTRWIGNWTPSSLTPNSHFGKANEPYLGIFDRVLDLRSASTVLYVLPSVLLKAKTAVVLDHLVITQVIERMLEPRHTWGNHFSTLGA